jgi:hypothetical protein
MTMAELRLTPPEPVELISPVEAAAIIDETHRDLEAWERRAADARDTADAAHAQAALEGADEQSSTWAIVRLQRFLDGLRQEAEDDAQTVVEAARRGARARVEEARAGATQIRLADAGPRPILSDAPVAPAPVTDPPVIDRRVAPVIAIPVPVPEAAVVAEPPATPEPETLVQWIPAGVDAPSTNGHAHTRPPVAAPLPAAVPVPTTVAEPVPVVEAPRAPVVVAATPATAPAPTAPQSERARKRLRGFPLSAVLEVVAVLLILLFILLRLS